MSNKITDLSERLFQIFSHPDFLSMKGLTNEMPIYIQAYEPNLEDNVRRMIESLSIRLRNIGVAPKSIDLFDLILETLEKQNILDELIQNEGNFDKSEILETLQNHSDPKTILIPHLMRAIEIDSTQLTLITGSGRIFPFLRTHTILESLQPAMLLHPVVIFFPGEYIQDPGDGSHLQLFGSIPSPKINNPYYRATNLDHYRILS